MTGASPSRLPRDSTRQAEGILYGELGYVLNRWSGLVILAFLIVHIAAQAVLHLPAFAAANAAAPWLPAVQNQPWLHAILYGCIAFHTLYGFKLIALDLGARLDYRLSFWAIAGLSALVFLREVLRYVGI